MLADCLAAVRPGLHTAAFQRYQQLRRARTRLVQRSSFDKSALLHLPDGPEALVRNTALLDLEKQVAWIHDFDAQQPTRMGSEFLHRRDQRPRAGVGLCPAFTASPAARGTPAMPCGPGEQ